MSELTITTITQRDPAIHRVHLAAYMVERVLIAYPNSPPLRVTLRQIQEEPDTFLNDPLALLRRGRQPSEVVHAHLYDDNVRAKRSHHRPEASLKIGR